MSMTLTLFAQNTGLSKGFLSDLENDKRDISSQNLLCIANVLGKTVDYLLNGKQLIDDQLPLILPNELSALGIDLNLSYIQVLKLYKINNLLLNRKKKQFSEEDWKQLYLALKPFL